MPSVANLGVEILFDLIQGVPSGGVLAPVQTPERVHLDNKMMWRALIVGDADGSAVVNVPLLTLRRNSPKSIWIVVFSVDDLCLLSGR